MVSPQARLNLEGRAPGAGRGSCMQDREQYPVPLPVALGNQGGALGPGIREEP